MRAELPAIEASVREMLRSAREKGVSRSGLPRIGAGLGGLHWKSVKAVLVRARKESDVELLVFEEFVKARLTT